MSSTVEIDPVIKSALKLLYSNSPDSAEKLRQCLDEIIKQRYGSGKMLINTLNKKYIGEETNFPGAIKRQKSSDSRSSASGKNSSPLPQEISMTPMEVINFPIEMSDIKNIDVSQEENLKEFGDLACVVCCAMVFTAGNRLVECADCHSLYHQECHKPLISDDDANEQEFSWCCTNCKNKVMTAKTLAITSFPSPSKSSSSRSSSSSSSSSPYYKNIEHGCSNKAKSNSSKTINTNSSSKAVLGTSTTGSSTSSPTLSISTSGGSSKGSLPTAHFNVISVDKRLLIMKKKAAKQQESKRGKK